MKEVKLTVRENERVQVLARLFNSNEFKVVKSACTGKYRGTYDYSIILEDSTELFICNGKKRFMSVVEDLIEIYSNFADRHDVILSKLRELQKYSRPNINKNLLPYTIEDIDYIKTGNKYIGWFVVTLKFLNNTKRIFLETGLNAYIIVLCTANNIDEVSNTRVVRSEYFTAGGIDDDEVDFVFGNVGHSTKSHLYTI